MRASENCFPFKWFTLIFLKMTTESMSQWQPPEHGSVLQEMLKNKFPTLCLILSKLGTKQSLWSCCASQVPSIKRSRTHYEQYTKQREGGEKKEEETFPPHAQWFSREFPWDYMERRYPIYNSQSALLALGKPCWDFKQQILKLHACITVQTLKLPRRIVIIHDFHIPISLSINSVI